MINMNKEQIERQTKVIGHLKKSKSIKIKMCMKINNVLFRTAILEMIKFGYLKEFGSYCGVNEGD